MLGLKEIEGNIAEGVVVKCADLIFKIKSKKFLEIVSNP